MEFTTTEKDGLKYELEVEKEHIERLQNIISKLTKERDEARVSVCKLTSQLNQELGAETLPPRQNAAQQSCKNCGGTGVVQGYDLYGSEIDIPCPCCNG